MRKITKILDATSGSGSEFYFKNLMLKGKLVITGTASSNIKAFFIEGYNGKDMLKIFCDSWNGASVALQTICINEDKTEFSGDSFSNSGVVYTENTCEICELN